MRNSFYNGFIDTDDLMPDSENNKIIIELSRKLLLDEKKLVKSSEIIII